MLAALPGSPDRAGHQAQGTASLVEVGDVRQPLGEEPDKFGVEGVAFLMSAG